jgi:hypothetical protein
MWLPYLKIRALYRARDVDAMASGVLPVWLSSYLNLTGIPERDREILTTLYQANPAVLDYAFSRRIEDNPFVTTYIVMTYYLPEEPKSYYSPEYFYYSDMMDFDVVDFNDKREFVLFVNGKKRLSFFQDNVVFKDAVCRLQPTDIFMKGIHKEVLYKKKGLRGSFVYLEHCNELMFRLDAVDFGITSIHMTPLIWEMFQKFVYVMKTLVKYESLIVYDGGTAIDVHILGDPKEVVDLLYNIRHLGVVFPEGAPSGVFVMPDWSDIEPISKMRYPGSINHSTGSICTLLDKDCIGRSLSYLKSINDYF